MTSRSMIGFAYVGTLRPARFCYIRFTGAIVHCFVSFVVHAQLLSQVEAPAWCGASCMSRNVSPSSVTISPDHCKYQTGKVVHPAASACRPSGSRDSECLASEATDEPVLHGGPGSESSCKLLLVNVTYRNDIGIAMARCTTLAEFRSANRRPSSLVPAHLHSSCISQNGIRALYELKWSPSKILFCSPCIKTDSCQTQCG